MRVLMYSYASVKPEVERWRPPFAFEAFPPADALVLREPPGGLPLEDAAFLGLGRRLTLVCSNE